MPNTKPIGVAYEDQQLDGAVIGKTGGTVGFYGYTPIAQRSGAAQATSAVGTASSTGTLKFAPALYTAASPLATVDSFPADNADITMLGSAASQYPQNLAYHRDAITFATADLIMPQGVDMASRQVHNGISMRIVRQYDINNDRLPCRIDVLYGYGVIRPQMAVRLWG